MEGSLERAGLTRVLQGFRTGRQTGVLHLDQNGQAKHVYFKNGDIVFASSDVGTERLGEFLVRSGKLTRAELELACKVRESSHLRLGKTLVDMGYVSDSELDGLVKQQVESILLSLTSWETGSYRAELRDNALDPKDADLLRADISTENILLETVRGLDDSDAIRSGIGDLTAPLRFARDPDWIGENLTLTSQEGFVLSRVDGESSTDEIAKLSPMGEDDTLRCICALIVAGVLETETSRVPVEPPPKVSAPRAVESSKTERRRYDFTLEKKRARPTTPAAEPPPAAHNATTRPKPKEPVAAGPPPGHYDARQMARLHFANGQRFFNEGCFHQAIEELQDAVRLDGGQGEYHRLLGNALVKNPKWQRRAEAHFLRVLEMDRFDIDTRLALGEIYEAGGMEQRARKVYEEALGLDPGNRRALEKLRGAPRTTPINKLKGILHRH